MYNVLASTSSIPSNSICLSFCLSVGHLPRFSSDSTFHVCHLVMYLPPFSPLDPSAEEKAQETFARLYKEHVTSGNTEDQTNTHTNNKTIHIRQEQMQSKCKEQKYESNTTCSKNSFHHLPPNGVTLFSNGVTRNSEEQVRRTTNPSHQLHKKPLSGCREEESKAASTNNNHSTTNTPQNVSREEQSNTMTTNTSTDAFVKNTFHEEQENNAVTKTSTHKNSLHQENTTTTKSSTDLFRKNALHQQQQNSTTTKTNTEAYMKNTLENEINTSSKTSRDTYMKNSVHHQQEENNTCTSSKSSSSGSSMCQESSTRSRYMTMGKYLTDLSNAVSEIILTYFL